MAGNIDPHSLIIRGSNLHESRRYKAALKVFDRALEISPRCFLALYNRANTLHMLGREKEAYSILRRLISATPTQHCPSCSNASLRSLQLDAYQLLFWVVLYGKGFCDEAFRYAREHIKHRRRGLRSAWTLREVQADVAAMRSAWKQQSK